MGGRRGGRGIFDVSLSEAVDFHMVEGGGRACEPGSKLRPASPRRAGAGAGRGLGPAAAGGEGPEPAPAPRPRPGLLRDTPRPAAGHLRARHVLPPVLLLRTLPPGLGAVTGGRGGTRRARRLQARAGERGAAGRSGRPGVWASVAPVSRSPPPPPRRGALWGWGGREGSAPRDGREGPRGPSGAGGAAGVGEWGAGGSDGSGVRRACHSGRPWGALGLCPRTLAKVRSWRPVGARAPGPVSRETGQGRPRRRWPGAFPGALLELGLLESPALPSPTERRAVAFLSRSEPSADFFKSYNFFFSLQPSVFLKQNLEFGQDGPALGP